MKKRLFAVLAAAALALLAACAGTAGPTGTAPTPGENSSPVPSSPPAAPTGQVLPTETATPGLVEVVLGVSSDSPDIAAFTVLNASGQIVYQTVDTLARSYTLLLPPGEYRWTANAPVPTPPLGCYTIPENYGFSKDGRFTAVNETIHVEIKIGFRLFLCTTTPEGT